jgi:hypothetical protein
LDVEVEGGLLRLSSFGFGVSVICCFFLCLLFCAQLGVVKMKGGGWSDVVGFVVTLQEMGER